MYIYFKKKHCPVCGVKGIKKGQIYECQNCETRFTEFGIVKGPFGIEESTEENIDNLLFIDN
ncbi:MAG: hypothetical protein B6U88_02715 [Candidatus Aenigmarchaeota archaeon ex4484_56]|nr:MAG: hypothetical protein B6U88_02715 [Candidatus Aenigmarchaeota archaeon ex4484_56]